MFSKGDILGYKANLHKYEKLEIVSCVLSDENEIHLETNNKRDLRIFANMETEERMVL